MDAALTSRLGDELSAEEVRHYSRHMLIPEMGRRGQRLLKGARVLLVGVGGLGSPAGQYLAASGVGTIGLVEYDDVDVSNLQRQVLYTTADVGQQKIERAALRLRAMNPHIDVVLHRQRIDAANAFSVVGDYDMVVDGTDNFATRYLINDTCVLLGKPNVYASVFRFDGLLSVFNHDGGPCYRCLYPSPPPPEFAPSCAEGGVFGVLPGVLGTLQAAEVIKLITGVGTTMSGRLLSWDAAEMKFRELVVRRDPACPLCGERRTQHGLIDYAQFCRGDALVPAHVCDQEPKRVSPQWLADQLQTGAALQLIDVRGASEYDIVHIEGAQLLPLDEVSEKLDRLDQLQLDPDVAVVCYCKSGIRSATAARLLIERGFRDVASLDGGILAWARDVDAAAAVY